MRQRTVVSVTVGWLALSALLAGCLSAGPGACGSADREFFGAIDQFDGVPLEPADHPYGVCAAIFTTDAPSDEVVAHYVEAFRNAGWDVGAPDSIADPGEPGLTSTTIVSAYRGTFQYHVDISEADSGELHVTVMAGDAGQN